MHKIILLLSIPLFSYTVSNAFNFGEMSMNIELHDLYRKRRTTKDSELEKKIDQLESKLAVLKPLNDLFDTIRFSELPDKDPLLTTLADISRFVYANSDLYTDDKPELKRRLKIYQLGEQKSKYSWFADIGGKGINEIAEMYHLANMALHLDEIPSRKISDPEEYRQEMFKDIQQRCLKDERLRDWGVRSHIEGIVTLGLKAHADRNKN